MRISVAIDGPAGAGKSSIAKIVAKRLNLMYINTGLMYRAITYKALKRNIPPQNIETLCKILDETDMYFLGDNLIVDGKDITKDLHNPEISKNVASYSSIAEIRERLVVLQRDLAKNYDVIMDGRDIGTVVLKNSAFKFFLTASPEERARRRYIELNDKGIAITFDEVLKDQLERDFQDTTRKVNPLTKAEDAVEVDTTGKSIEEVVEIISNIIRKGLSTIDD